MILLDAETRSLKRASIVMKRVFGLEASANTIERVALEVGNDLEVAEREQWRNVLTGEVTVPSLAIVEFDGGRRPRSGARRASRVVVLACIGTPRDGMKPRMRSW